MKKAEGAIASRAAKRHGRKRSGSQQRGLEPHESPCSLWEELDALSLPAGLLRVA